MCPTRTTVTSKQLIAEAKRFIPGGVNSPARSFQGVGGDPVFFARAEGAYLYDEDSNAYLDYVGSWGPMILGHQDKDVIGAVQEAVKCGLSYGAPTRVEIELAKLICEYMPSIEMIRMVGSGTEATMTAIRLARGYTNRSLLVKFTGCYHGHSDSLLIQAGSGLLTQGIPSSAGVPESIAAHTLTLPYNDIEALETLFLELNTQVAAVIVEPVAGNMGCVPPLPGFLNRIRELCDTHGSVLIFDEVMTGFRVHQGGAQAYYDIQPDLTTLGKIVGGGMPVGAIGGRRDIMSYLAPLGPVYQAGTLSGNPISMTAGLATLQKLAEPGFYEKIAYSTDLLARGFRAIAQHNNVALTINHVPGMFSIFFGDQPVRNLEEAKSTQVDKFKKFFHAMLNEGIYLPPSAFESWFIPIDHTESEIDHTVKTAGKIFAHL